MPGAGLLEHPRGSPTGQQRVGRHRGEVGSRPQQHDAPLAVAQVRRDGGHRHAALDVRLDDPAHPGRVDVQQRDVGEVARVVVAAGDQRRGRSVAARQQQVTAVRRDTGHGQRRGARGLVIAALHRRHGAGPGLEQRLLECGPAAVDDPVEAVPDATVGDVPAP